MLPFRMKFMFIHMTHDNRTHNYEYVQGYEYGYLTRVAYTNQEKWTII